MALIATVDTGTTVARPPARGRRIVTFLKSVLRHERLLFWALVVVHLIPIWAFRYLPTTDGPAHLANADVMRRIGEAGPVGEVFRKYYFISGTPSPNLAGHLMLAGLMYVMPPIAAEKVVLSLYVVLLPVAMRYAVGRIRRRGNSAFLPGASATSGGDSTTGTPLHGRQECLPHSVMRSPDTFIAFLAFPMTYSFLLGQGFYNFCLSLAAFLFTVGYWFGHRQRMDVRRAVGLLGLAMALYACHLFSLMMACGVIGMSAGWFLLVAWRKGDRAAVRMQIHMALITGAALLPAVIPAVIFRPSTHVPWLNHDIGKSSLREDLVGLLQFQTMVSYRKSEALLGAALVAVFASLTLFALMAKTRRRARSAWDILLLAPIGLAIVYLRASDATSIHFYIPPRVMYYAFLILGLWLAAQPFPRVVRGAVPLFCAVLALGFATSHATKYRQFAPQLAEYVAAGEKIERGSTFLPLVYAPQGRGIGGRAMSSDVAPFYMASGYIAVARGAVDLRNYEGRTDHFPVRFKADVNPFEKLTEGNGLEQAPPPRVEFEKFEKAGGRVDYVLIWGRSEDQKAQAWADAFLESAIQASGRLDCGAILKMITAAQQARDGVRLDHDLETRYERVELPGAKWTELWKRK